MKSVLFWLTSVLSALILGIGSAYLALYLVVSGTENIFSGNWATNKTTGSVDAGVYTRTSVAVMGLLAMSQQESIYYSTILDADGNVLSGSCTYEMKGRDLASRWWSITAYGMDHYFMKNPEKRYSISKTSVVRDEDGSYTTILSPNQHDGNWIATSRGRYYQLTARFYNPKQSVYDKPAEVSLPVIRKVKCT